MRALTFSSFMPIHPHYYQRNKDVLQSRAGLLPLHGFINCAPTLCMGRAYKSRPYIMYGTEFINYALVWAYKSRPYIYFYVWDCECCPTISSAVFCAIMFLGSILFCRYSWCTPPLNGGTMVDTGRTSVSLVSFVPTISGS